MAKFKPSDTGANVNIAVLNNRVNVFVNKEPGKFV